MKNESTKVYVVYRSKAADYVRERLDYISSANPNIIFFNFLDNEEKCWKRKAKRKIRECAFALFFYDDYLIQEEKDIKNIKFELDQLKKYGRKVISVYASSEDDLEKISNAISKGTVDEACSNQTIQASPKMAKELFGSDFSDKDYDKERFKPLTLEDAKKRVLAYSEWSADASIKDDSTITDVELKKEYYQLLIKQYELMINTSEELMKRRSEMIDKYRAICIALMSLVSATLVFGNLFVTGILMIFAGIVTICLTKPWRSALLEFSKNNAGKFAVINAIEKKLPADMFDNEYTFNVFKGIKTYSVRELSFPKIFLILGIAVSVIGATFITLVVIHACTDWFTPFFDLFKPKNS